MGRARFRQPAPGSTRTLRLAGICKGLRRMQNPEWTLGPTCSANRTRLQRGRRERTLAHQPGLLPTRHKRVRLVKVPGRRNQAPSPLPGVRLPVIPTLQMTLCLSKGLRWTAPIPPGLQRSPTGSTRSHSKMSDPPACRRGTQERGGIGRLTGDSIKIATTLTVTVTGMMQEAAASAVQSHPHPGPIGPLAHPLEVAHGIVQLGFRLRKWLGPIELVMPGSILPRTCTHGAQSLQ